METTPFEGLSDTGKTSPQLANTPEISKKNQLESLRNSNEKIATQAGEIMTGITNKLGAVPESAAKQAIIADLNSKVIPSELTVDLTDKKGITVLSGNTMASGARMTTSEGEVITVPRELTVDLTDKKGITVLSGNTMASNVILKNTITTTPGEVDMGVVTKKIIETSKVTTTPGETVVTTSVSKESPTQMNTPTTTPGEVDKGAVDTGGTTITPGNATATGLGVMPKN